MQRGSNSPGSVFVIPVCKYKCTHGGGGGIEKNVRRAEGKETITARAKRFDPINQECETAGILREIKTI